MKILILGGTRFLGRHLAEQALAQGHKLTLLHRGRSATNLFPEADHRIADRDGDLAALEALDRGTWDAAIDTSAYFPRQVRAVAAALAGRVGHYQLVSSISVYKSFDAPGTAEDAPLITLPDPEVQEVTAATYGGLKALCEAAAMAGFDGRCAVSRPGLIVGPHDPTGRFTWWVQRLQRGGELLAPGDPATPVQFIDARDLAAWLLLQAERGSTGVYNLNGPDAALSMGEFLRTAQATLNPAATLTWVDEAFVLAQGVAPWSDLPVWLPRESAAMHQVSVARARDTGLVCRPLAHTLRDTAAWAAATLPQVQAQAPADQARADAPARPAVGLAAAREAALLQAWRQRTTG